MHHPLGDTKKYPKSEVSSHKIVLFAQRVHKEKEERAERGERRERVGREEREQREEREGFTKEAAQHRPGHRPQNSLVCTDANANGAAADPPSSGCTTAVQDTPSTGRDRGIEILAGDLGGGRPCSCKLYAMNTVSSAFSFRNGLGQHQQRSIYDDGARQHRPGQRYQSTSPGAACSWREENTKGEVA